MADWEFKEQGHQYLYQGKPKPSVSKLVDFAVGDIYKGIPKRILDNKANYGTKVHSVIQNYIQGKDPKAGEHINTLAEFIMLTDGIEFAEVEKMVCFQDRYAGRFDLMDKDGYIYDIKTTAKLHKQNLEWQLGLYYMASGSLKRKGYCVWLPKGKDAKLVEIKPKTKAECLDLLERYETDCQV